MKTLLSWGAVFLICLVTLFFLTGESTASTAAMFATFQTSVSGVWPILSQHWFNVSRFPSYKFNPCAAEII